MENKNLLQFWNQQAALSEKAGSRDLIAKELEVAALARHIQNGKEICEFGCGNGVTAIQFAQRFDSHIDAFDFSSAMIDAARLAAKEACVDNKIDFEVADVQGEPKLSKRYDIIYTERMLINLKNWELQERAIRFLSGNLKPRGRLLLCENSVEGLGKLNQLREMVGLDRITAPWHNCYLSDKAVEGLHGKGLTLVSVEPFSATYYFLSRVVNAWLAKREGIEPAYDAPVNQLALSLPAFGDCAQGKLWVFEKK